jgi:glycosyltransferase involved in cell wall biosynthesis
MMGSPLVSIIVPCYNYAEFLEETLRDLLKQEYAIWECIIVNDGSTDHTEEVARQFMQRDARFRYCFQANQGLSSARNLGIRESKGSLLQFLDSDDFIHPSKLFKQVSELEKHPEVEIIYGNSLFFFGGDRSQLFQTRTGKKKLSGQKLRASGKGQVILKQLLKNNLMEVSCCLARRSVIDKVGFFDERFKSYEDWQYWVRCAIAGISFQYFAEQGTETFIRCGHDSMMRNRKKLAEHGLMIRKQLHPQLTFPQKIYNYYRMAKLQTRLIFKIY